MSAAICFVLGTVLYLPLALWRGFVLAKLWAWHVAPTFAVPEVSTVQAAALALLVGVLTQQSTDDGREPGEIILAMVFESLLIGGFGLLFGWVFATWVGTA